MATVTTISSILTGFASNLALKVNVHLFHGSVTYLIADCGSEHVAPYNDGALWCCNYSPRCLIVLP